MSEVSDQYPVVFPMASDALDFAVQLGIKFVDGFKAVIVTKQMELTGDRFDGAALQLATSILGKTNLGRVMVSLATVEILDEDVPRSYSLIPVGRPVLDDGRQVALFKVLHSAFSTDYTPDFSQRLTNLPRWGGEFVGRERELDDLQRRTFASRAVVALGASGIGKTRLLVEYGNRILADQPGGVWYVDLRYAPQTPRLLEDHVAKKLGLKANPEQSPLELMIEFLQGHGTTVILDACEVAVGPITNLVNELLVSCPNLQVLMGTQDPMPLSSHAVYRVPPMRSDSDGDEESDCIKLFRARGELYEENFDPSDRELEEIAGLCENLAGVPLAIELAAAAYVNQGQVKTTPGTDRSATKNVLNWIAQNLDPNERRLAEACALFRSPIEQEFAHQIAGGTTDDDFRSLRTWAVLRVDGEGNVRMPRGIQSYFAGVSKPKKKALAEAHAACFTEEATKWEKIYAEERRLDGFARHADDCHEALAWACDNRQVERIISLIYSLFDFWYGFGRFEEALGWCNRALDACSEDEVVQSRIYNMACGLAMGVADFDGAIRYADEGIKLATKHKQKPILSRLYLQAGSALWAIQEYDRALAALRECRKGSKSLGIEYGVLISELYMASAESERGNFEKAEKGLGRLRNQPLPPQIKTILDLHQGTHRLMQGRIIESRDLLEQAFIEFQKEGNTVGCMSAMRMMVPGLAKSGLAYIAAWIDGMLHTLNLEVPLYWHRPQRVLYREAIDDIRRVLGEGVYLDQFEHGQYTSLEAFKKFVTKEAFLTDMD